MLMRYRLHTDRRLAELWLNGDRRAGDEIARRHRPGVLRFAARAYHMSPDDAEEIAQEAFFRLQRSLHAFHWRASLSTFLRAIANRVCLDWKRVGRRRMAEVPLQAAALVGDSADDPGGRALFPADLARCLERLTERARLVFLSRALRGESYEELAGRFGMTSGAVGRVLFEARQVLAQCLDEYVTPKIPALPCA